MLKNTCSGFDAWILRFRTQHSGTQHSDLEHSRRVLEHPRSGTQRSARAPSILPEHPAFCQNTRVLEHTRVLGTHCVLRTGLRSKGACVLRTRVLKQLSVHQILKARRFEKLFEAGGPASLSIAPWGHCLKAISKMGRRIKKSFSGWPLARRIN